MVINRLQLAVLQMAIQAVSSARDIDIYSMRDGIADMEKPMQFGVNWGCYGTQSAEDTVDFAKKLMRAADIAQALTSLEIVVDYMAEAEFKDVAVLRVAANRMVDAVESAVASIIKVQLLDIQ